MVNKRQQKKNDKNDYQFSVGKKTEKEYKKAIRNTKSKINRIKRNYGIDVSDKISTPKLEDFSSRKDFNTWVRKSESFRNRNNQNFQFVKNDYDVSIDKKTLHEIERKNKRVREMAIKEIEKTTGKPFRSGGEEQGTVGLQRPKKHGINVPVEFDFSDVRSKQRLDEIMDSLNKRVDPEYYDKRKVQAKENFITMLEGSFNSLADDLVTEIKKLHPETFWELYLSEDDFDFDYYDTEGQMIEQDESSIGRMLVAIERYNDGNTDTDMWHENFRK